MSSLPLNFSHPSRMHSSFSHKNRINNAITKPREKEKRKTKRDRKEKRIEKNKIDAFCFMRLMHEQCKYSIRFLNKRGKNGKHWKFNN